MPTKEESKNNDLVKTQETLPDIFTTTNAALSGIEEAAKKIPVELIEKSDYKICETLHKKNKKLITAIKKYSKEKLEEVKEIFESKKLEINTQENAILNRLDVVQLKLGTSRTNYEDAIDAAKLKEREAQLELRIAEALKLEIIENEISAIEENRLFMIAKEQAATAETLRKQQEQLQEEQDATAKTLQDEKEKLQKERDEFERMKIENEKTKPQTAVENESGFVKLEPATTPEKYNKITEKELMIKSEVTAGVSVSVDDLNKINKNEPLDPDNCDDPYFDQNVTSEILAEFKTFWDEFTTKHLIEKTLVANVSDDCQKNIEMFFFDIQEAVKEFEAKTK